MECTFQGFFADASNRWRIIDPLVLSRSPSPCLLPSAARDRLPQLPSRSAMWRRRTKATFEISNIGPGHTLGPSQIWLMPQGVASLTSREIHPIACHALPS